MAFCVKGTFGIYKAHFSNISNGSLLLSKAKMSTPMKLPPNATRFTDSLPACLASGKIALYG